jgi:small multidrug resistance family-3 protein
MQAHPVFRRFKVEGDRRMLESLGLFALAGLCEIGGGYLVWLWLREDKGWL